MDCLSPSDQEQEIDRSLEFLNRVGSRGERWIMCYPYGRYSASLLEVMRRRGAAIGLTIRAAVADLAVDSPLVLPRLDTNDLPAE
jgi:hypothetical protein